MRVRSLVGAPTLPGAVGFFVAPASCRRARRCRLEAGATRDGVRLKRVAGRSKVRPLHLPIARNVSAPTFGVRQPSSRLSPNQNRATNRPAAAQLPPAKPVGAPTSFSIPGGGEALLRKWSACFVWIGPKGRSAIARIMDLAKMGSGAAGHLPGVSASLVGAPTMPGAVGFFVAPAFCRRGLRCRLDAAATRDGVCLKRVSGRSKVRPSAELMRYPLPVAPASSRHNRARRQDAGATRKNSVGAPTFSFWNWVEVAG